ncbi:MAG TPA: MarR family transcriptional regulator [Streptosporangiaceae bacterium]|nr:MarR family transcriptional regulator [Streptosporangiaceae bacterium]
MAQSRNGETAQGPADVAGPDATGGTTPRRDDGTAVFRDGAADRDGKAVARFVEDLASALMEMGVPRMPARIFAALLTTDAGRLTATELADSLQVSPAAVSGAVRYLLQIGMVRRESEPGSRRHYYRAPDDVWDEVIGIRDRLMARWTGVLREGVQVLGADTPAGQRVADSARFFEFVSTELPRVIGRWRERRPARDGEASGDR